MSSEFDINEDNIGEAETTTVSLESTGNVIDELREEIQQLPDTVEWSGKVDEALTALKNIEPALAAAREQIDAILESSLEDAIEAYYDQEE